MDVEALVQHTAQVAVSEHAADEVFGIVDGSHAKFLCRHFQQAVADGGVFAHRRKVAAAVHDVCNFQQEFAPEVATRVRKREIFRGETPRFE